MTRSPRPFLHILFLFPVWAAFTALYVSPLEFFDVEDHDYFIAAQAREALGDRSIPLTHNFTTGNVLLLATMPFLPLFDQLHPALHLRNVLYALFTISTVYLFAFQVLKSRAAAMAVAFFFSTFPDSFLGFRYFAISANNTVPWQMLSLVFLSRSQGRSSNARDLFFSGLMAGLNVNAHASGLVFIPAWGAFLFGAALHRKLGILRSTGIACAGLVLPLIPLAAAWAGSAGAMWPELTESASKMENMRYGHHLAGRLTQIKDMFLLRSWLSHCFLPNGAPFRAAAGAVLVLAAGGALLSLRGMFVDGRLAWTALPALFTVSILVLSPFTFGSRHSAHMIQMVPYLALGMVSALVRFGRPRSPSAHAWMTPLVLFNLYHLVLMDLRLRQIPSRTPASVQEMVSFVAAFPGAAVVGPDPVSSMVRSMGGPRNPAFSAPEYETPDRILAAMREWMSEPRNSFLLVHPERSDHLAAGWSDYRAFIDAFREVAAERGLSFAERRLIFNEVGEPLFSVRWAGRFR